jgi:hypothetical protein
MGSGNEIEKICEGSLPPEVIEKASRGRFGDAGQIERKIP